MNEEATRAAVGSLFDLWINNGFILNAIYSYYILMSELKTKKKKNRLFKTTHFKEIFYTEKSFISTWQENKIITTSAALLILTAANVKKAWDCILYLIDIVHLAVY